MAESFKEYGLAGYPLGHSFSQRFFTEKFANENINARYLNFELPEIGLLAEVIAAHPELRGFNVTIPYKQAIIPMLTSLSEDARRIGAVNTVKVKRLPDNTIELTGFNTDITGFTESLRPHLKDGKHRRALVLGTGGASKAIVAGLRQLQIEPTLVSRSAGPGHLTYDSLNPEVMATHLLVVNATPLGMWPNVDTCPPIPYGLLTPRHICFDAVYNPCPTLFMRLAAERGAEIIGGLEMLRIQALTAWQIWND